MPLPLERKNNDNSNDNSNNNRNSKNDMENIYFYSLSPDVEQGKVIHDIYKPGGWSGNEADDHFEETSYLKAAMIVGPFDSIL